jgi:hypothetical protein
MPIDPSIYYTLVTGLVTAQVFLVGFATVRMEQRVNTVQADLTVQRKSLGDLDKYPRGERRLRAVEILARTLAALAPDSSASLTLSVATGFALGVVVVTGLWTAAYYTMGTAIPNALEAWLPCAAILISAVIISLGRRERSRAVSRLTNLVADLASLLTPLIYLWYGAESFRLDVAETTLMDLQEATRAEKRLTSSEVDRHQGLGLLILLKLTLTNRLARSRSTTSQRDHDDLTSDLAAAYAEILDVGIAPLEESITMLADSTAPRLYGTPFALLVAGSVLAQIDAWGMDDGVVNRAIDLGQRLRSGAQKLVEGSFEETPAIRALLSQYQLTMPSMPESLYERVVDRVVDHSAPQARTGFHEAHLLFATADQMTSQGYYGSSVRDSVRALQAEFWGNWSLPLSNLNDSERHSLLELPTSEDEPRSFSTRGQAQEAIVGLMGSASKHRLAELAESLDWQFLLQTEEEIVSNRTDWYAAHKFCSTYSTTPSWVWCAKRIVFAGLLEAYDSLPRKETLSPEQLDLLLRRGIDLGEFTDVHAVMSRRHGLDLIGDIPRRLEMELELAIRAREAMDSLPMIRENWDVISAQQDLFAMALYLLWKCGVIEGERLIGGREIEPFLEPFQCECMEREAWRQALIGFGGRPRSGD